MPSFEFVSFPFPIPFFLRLYSLPSSFLFQSFSFFPAKKSFLIPHSCMVWRIWTYTCKRFLSRKCNRRLIVMRRDLAELKACAYAKTSKKLETWRDHALLVSRHAYYWYGKCTFWHHFNICTEY